MSMPARDTTTTDPKTWALIVWGLYIASYFTGITAIIGVIIAYVKRKEVAGTPFESHMIYAIRTFWISLIGIVISCVLLIVGIGFILLAALAIWQIYRIVRGIIRALDSQPIDNPEGWL